MQLCITQDDWGVAQPHDIEKLLKDTASHLNQLLRNPFEGRISVEPSPPGKPPRALYRESSADPFVIWLSARDRHWCQYAYQFSHEFCHVLSGYERLKGNPNNWFHEAICELASVFTLRRMAERWPTTPPCPNWADYAQALQQYSQDLLSCPESQLPAGMNLHAWLSSHEDVLREDEYQRKKNKLVAYALLPIFESLPMGWNAIRSLPTFLGYLKEYFADWHSSADPADKDFIARLSNAFDYTIG